MSKRWIGISAFGFIYFVWGANFVAIRFAIESIPPFLMAGTRFFVAGAIIYLWLRLTGESRPAFRVSIPSIRQGIWLNVLGTGGLVWAQQYIPSGLAAIVLATIPVWMIVLEKEKWGTHFKNPYIGMGLVAGILGVLFLSDYGTLGYLSENATVYYTGLLVLVVATVCWSRGSLFANTGDEKLSLAMSLAIQMIAAGTSLYGLGLLSGEHLSFTLSGVTSESMIALLFLILFSSIIGYLAYLWLLKEYPPSLVGTYAYVHPLVAVLLGWLLADEQITTHMIFSLTLILAAIFLIRYAYRKRDSKRREEPQSESADGCQRPEL